MTEIPSASGSGAFLRGARIAQNPTQLAYLFAQPMYLSSIRRVDKLAQSTMIGVALRNVKQDRPFEIQAMVVLPDHLHAVWRLPPGDADYSSRWRDIKHDVSIAIPAPVNHRGEKAVWQRRFWEHTIRDEEDSRRHVDYVHFNPVKHRLVRAARDWPHSSFPAAVAKGWYTEDWGRVEPEDIRDWWLE